MIEWVDFSVSYVSVAIIKPLRIIVALVSSELLIILILDISNALQNTILPNPEERFYLSLPHLYLEWLKIKLTKHPLVSISTR